MVDLNKLNAQLKDFDPSQINKIFGEYQNSFIKLVLIAGSLLVAGLMYNDHRARDQALVTQTSKAKEKIEVIKVRDAAVGDLAKFKSSLPHSLSESRLITLISKYAKLRHVTISSLSPGDTRDMGNYDIIDVSFVALSDSFKSVILFLRDIEKSNPALRIDLWSGQEMDSGKINFGIKVSAVFIHS